MTNIWNILITTDKHAKLRCVEFNHESFKFTFIIHTTKHGSKSITWQGDLKFFKSTNKILVLVTLLYF